MKIRKVHTFLLRAPLDTAFFFSQPGLVRMRTAMIVELVTDNGLSGFGESLMNGLEPPEIARSVVHASLEALLLDQDPFDIGVLYERMYNRTKDYGLKGAVVSAISAVDIALWDIVGKACQKPIHKLLGGAFRTDVVPYATGFYRQSETEPEDDRLVEEALGHQARGFSAMKVKIGFGVDEDIRVMTKIRERVGPQIRLMADANHAYNASVARRLVRELDALNVFWLEEPISPEDIEGYRDLKTMGSAVLIAAGENEYTRYGFWPWAIRRAVDVLQPDITACGGLTGAKEILTLALASGLLLNPHVWGTAIGLAASLQFLAVIPPNPISRGQLEPMLEYDQSGHPFRQELVSHPVLMANGRVPIPDGPGLGIEVRRDVLERYSV